MRVPRREGSGLIRWDTDALVDESGLHIPTF